MPLISLIIPVYKVEPYLRRCLDSVLAQTLPDFDVFCIDDGSPDTCGALCEEYAARDPRIHVIHRENGGLSAARNTGLDRMFADSDSRYVSFIDSDDWVHPQYLELLYRAVEMTQAPLAIGKYVATDVTVPDLPITAPCLRCLSAEETYVSCPFTMPAWGKLYHRSLFETLRFPEGKLHEDAYTTHRLLFEAQQAAVLSEPLYYYNTASSGIMRSSWTPRRMDECEARRQRRSYFWDNGYFRAYEAEVISSLWMLEGQLRDIAAAPAYAAYRVPLKRELRSLLAEAKALPFEQRLYFHFLLHPRLVGPFRRVYRALKR